MIADISNVPIPITPHKTASTTLWYALSTVYPDALYLKPLYKQLYVTSSLRVAKRGTPTVGVSHHLTFEDFLSFHNLDPYKTSIPIALTVRNPYVRQLSWYNYILHSIGMYKNKGKLIDGTSFKKYLKTLFVLYNRIKNRGDDEFGEATCNNIELILNKYNISFHPRFDRAHFRNMFPCIAWANGHCENLQIIKTETFNADVKRIYNIDMTAHPRLNTSEYDSSIESVLQYYDREMLDIVTEMHKLDFTTVGYEIL